MYEPLPEKDRIKLALAAEHVHRAKEEAYRAERELEQADDATLRAILDDQASPTLSRQIALSLLMSEDNLRHDGTLSSIMLPLLDDPDEELARSAIRQSPPNDPEVTTRLHALLDD